MPHASDEEAFTPNPFLFISINFLSMTASPEKALAVSEKLL
jgi:hypothetical protein